MNETLDRLGAWAAAHPDKWAAMKKWLMEDNKMETNTDDKHPPCPECKGTNTGLLSDAANYKCNDCSLVFEILNKRPEKNALQISDGDKVTVRKDGLESVFDVYKVTLDPTPGPTFGQVFIILKKPLTAPPTPGPEFQVPEGGENNEKS